MKKLLLKSIVFFSFIAIFLFIFPKNSHAQVLINEFSSFSSDDWVELVNIGSSPVALENYVIRDLTQTNKIELNGTLDPNGIISFNFSDSLIKDGDAIKIIRKENGTEIETVFALCYGDEANNSVCDITSARRINCKPGTDQSSVGSYPSDGGNTYERFLSSTKGLSNSNATLDPCPTPTPTPTNSPTNTPTNSPTNTPTPTLKPTNTLTPTVSKKPTNTPTEPEESPAEGDELVLGSSDSLLSSTPTPTETLGESSDGKNFPFIPVLFILLGVGFIGSAIFLLVKNRKEGLNVTENFTIKDN